MRLKNLMANYANNNFSVIQQSKKGKTQRTVLEIS